MLGMIWNLISNKAIRIDFDRKNLQIFNLDVLIQMVDKRDQKFCCLVSIIG
jgi:hypothetical protein